MTSGSHTTSRQGSPAHHSDMQAPANFAPNRSPRQYLGLIARGFAMGCADIVPGVSGGTMAFILGIYEELVISNSRRRAAAILAGASAAQRPRRA